MASTSEKNSPVHMSGAVVPPFWDAWIWNVVHKNAPGAMSAMAFTVMPVRLRLGFIPLAGAVVVSATRLLSLHPECDRARRCAQVRTVEITCFRANTP